MYNLYKDVHENKSFKKYRVADLLFAEYTCEPGELRSKLWSSTNYFTFVTQGRIELTTLTQTYSLEVGKAFFVRKGSCVFQLFPEEMYCEMIIFVSDEHIKAILDKHHISLPKDPDFPPTDLVIPLELDDTLQNYRQSLLSYFQRSEGFLPSLLQVKFEELLLNVLVQQRHPVLLRCFSEIYQSHKKSISHIMEQNYCSDLSMKEFARLCARSLSSFRRDFQAYYGMPPGRWLKEKRLQRSKVLLMNSDLTLEAICFECGFRNRSHFSRIFKEQFGLSPQAFRKG
ncbi:MAG: AraC family transcriptional regulator [Bacteroidota bacterium]